MQHSLPPNPEKNWAEVYDSVYAYVTEDIPFYVEEARRSGSGPASTLQGIATPPLVPTTGHSSAARPAYRPRMTGRA